MKLLKFGSVGALVHQWQDFLHGQGHLLQSTGLFDEATVAASKAFQARHKLTADGVVGNQTFGKAAMLGFELVEFSETESDYPAQPGFSPLLSTADRQALFGPLEFAPAPTADNPEAIRVTNGWDTKQVIKLTVPQVIGIPGASRSGTVYFHRKAAAQFQALWSAWEKAGLLPLVLSYEGAYNPRFVRGLAHKQVLSNHAFGTAFDINYRWNKLGTEPATAGQVGCVYRLVPLAHAHGFYWGGHFTRRDGMHFELARLM